MNQTFVVTAEARVDQGKGASRRLRRTGRLPAIVYGGNKPPQSISVDHNELWKSLKHEAFYSKILTLNIGSDTEQVVLKDLHRHPVRAEVMHMDLQRVLADVEIRIRVPLHFKGEDIAPGVKTGGGMLDHLMNEVEVECLPAALPEFLELDVSAMEVGDSIHLSQIPLPAGVTLVELKHDNDEAVVAVHMPRVSAATEEEDAEAAEEDEKKEDKK